GVWKVYNPQKEKDGEGNVAEERSDKSLQNDTEEFVGNVSKTTPINLETGDHSCKDMENINPQDPFITNFPQAKEFPNIEIPAADKGATFIENPRNFLEVPVTKDPMEWLRRLNERCLFSSFLVDHQYTCREMGEISVDDEMGLMCQKEPPDKGFYSNNYNTYHIELDSHDSDFDNGMQEQCQTSIQPKSF
ncbi:unnamed protein product, partial [Ilex paraguariensis]